MLKNLEVAVLGKENEGRKDIGEALKRAKQLKSVIKLTDEERAQFDDRVLDRVTGMNDGIIDDEMRQRRLLREQIKQRYSKKPIQTKVTVVVKEKPPSVPDRLLADFYRKKKEWRLREME